MHEFTLINNYLKLLSRGNLSALNLSDDIFYNKKKKLALSVDTFVHGVHFFSTEPKKFLKKTLRAAISDLYCKGINPSYYFLSLSLPKNLGNKFWIKKVINILQKEQNKFGISLSGGDTTFSPKFSLSITVIGYSRHKPVLRDGSILNDDVYVTGNISDSYIGLQILKKKKNFGKLNHLFKRKFYEPDLPYKFSSYLHTFANASIDISDGLINDLRNLCLPSSLGAFIDLNLLPLSISTRKLIKSKKLNLRQIFSNGDDYQILFTSKQKNRSKIAFLSKKTNTKVTKIGLINDTKKIVISHNGIHIHLNPKKMGYIHSF